MFSLSAVLMPDDILSPDGNFIWDSDSKKWVPLEKLDIKQTISDSVISGDVNTHITTVINSPDDIAEAIGKVLRGEASFEDESEVEAYNTIHRGTENKILCADEEMNLAKSAHLLGKLDDFVFHSKRCIDAEKNRLIAKNGKIGPGWRSGSLSDMYTEFGDLMMQSELFSDAIELFEDAITTLVDEEHFSVKDWYMPNLMGAVLRSGDLPRYSELVNKRVEFCKNESKNSPAAIWALIGAGIVFENKLGKGHPRSVKFFRSAIEEIDRSPYDAYDIDLMKISGWPQELSERGFSKE